MIMHKKDAGQAVVVVALALIVILAFLGLGLDLGYLRMKRRQIQKAADAAALAGSLELTYCGGTNNCSALTTAAQNALTENGFSSSTLATNCGTSSDNLVITVNNPPCYLGANDPHNGDARYVEVVVSQVEPLMFTKVLGIASTTMKARAEAGLGNSSNCFYVLGSSGTDLTVSGSVQLKVPGCGLYVNSNSTTAPNAAVEVTGSSSITAASVNIVGHAATSGTSTISPTPTTGVPPASDPLAYLSKPGYMACSTGVAQLSIGGITTQTLTPGNYCGGISIANSAVVTFSPGNYVVANGIQIGGAAKVIFGAGTYVMEGGGFSVGNSGQATGSGVTVFLTGDSNFSYGPANFSGAAVVQLIAPTSGTYAGILFFQDSTATGTTSPTSGNTSNFGGSASTYFQGALYFPTTGIVYSGASTAQYTILVANQVTVSNSATINNDYSSLASGTPIKGTGGILGE